MDQIIVDITAVTLSGLLPKIGDEAVIMGTQKGESISVDEIAHWADTISYEILCSLGNRQPRVYHS
jgi:alanine racemase